MKYDLDSKQYQQAYRKFQNDYLTKHHEGIVTDGLCDAMANSVVELGVQQLIGAGQTLEDWKDYYCTAESELERFRATEDWASLTGRE